MRKLLILACLLFVSVAAWRVTERLSSDAIGMGLGVLFGMLAGIPTALLVVAAARRREEHAAESKMMGQGRNMGYGYPGIGHHQPPVIIVTGNGAPAQMMNPTQGGYEMPGRYALPAPTEMPAQRKFKMVGEQEGWVDEF